MRRLSSKNTGLYQRLFPAFWFVVLFCGFLPRARVQPQSADEPSSDPMFPLMPRLMAGMGFVFLRRLIFAPRDEVWPGGNWLVVKNLNHSRRVVLSDVMNLNATTTTNLRPVTVTQSATRSGCRISSVPAGSRGFLSVSMLDPVALDLTRRVDAARHASR